MIKIENFIKHLQKNNINQYVGVPDSLLKPLTTYLAKKKPEKNLICVNEGAAISFAMGYYISSKKICCVYMQNSGLGNSINPLVSMADPKIYSLPMLLIIGWRGQPGLFDEAQHVKQGKITIKLLNVLGIKYIILKSEKDFKNLDKLVLYSKNNQAPVAVIIKKNILEPLKLKTKAKKNLEKKIDRSVFIEKLLDLLKPNNFIVSSTGYISRDLYRLSKKNRRKKNFYCVGGMGHAQMLALGIIKNTKKKIICIDGDGSLMMHMGSTVHLSNNSNNLAKYILLNNGVHESVGGQYCPIQKINIKLFSKSMGYKNYIEIKKEIEMEKKIKLFLFSKKTCFLNVLVNKNSETNLPRIRNLTQVKKTFMLSLKK